MSAEHITRISMAEARARSGKTDWERLAREEAAGIEPEADTPDGAFDWMRAVVLQKPQKQAMTIRLDEDVLTYFRNSGKGWQTRINTILRAWVDAEEKRAR